MRARLVLLARVARGVSVPVNDCFFLAGALLVSVGAGIERLSVGLIVAGVLLLVVAVGGVRS